MRNFLGSTMAFPIGVWALIAFLAVPVISRAQDIHDSLVVHLTFDGDVLDHSGNGNDGTIVRPGTNSPYVPGIITVNRTSASAFETTGPCLGTHAESNNYITFGVPAPGSALDFGDGVDFSFSFWGLIPAPGTTFHDPSWISNKDWDSGGNVGYVLATQGPPYTGQTGGFKWNFTTKVGPRNDSFRCDNCSLDDGAWHHYAVTFVRQGDGVMYIDGSEFNRVTLQGGVGSLDVGFPVNVMQDGTGNYTDGSDCANWNDASICDLGIWRRAITGDEVNLIYTMGLQGISPID
jgi:Concanavalin A-like lectin/glucanases superfamily